MGVLEAVLAYKQNQEQIQRANAESIGQAFNVFNATRQQGLQNQMAQLQMRASLAEKGLIQDNSAPSGFRRDASLMNPADLFLQQGKMADAYKSLVDTGFISPSGGGQSPMGGIQMPQGMSSVGGVQMPQGNIGAAPISAPGAVSQSPMMVSGQTLNSLGVPTSTSVTNPSAKAAEAGATDMGKAQATANQDVVRDNTQLQSVGETLKNLNDLHAKLSDKGIAGTNYGDIAISSLAPIGTVAKLLGQNPTSIQNKVLSPDDQNMVGEFTAARNEGITRAIQPLQNQLGKDGSSRISESLMKLTQSEYGGLNDTHAMFQGKLAGTAKTLYRISQASQQYAQDLASGKVQKPSNPNEGAKEIYSRMGDLNDTQKTEMQSFVDNVTGKNEKSSSSPFSVGQIYNGEKITGVKRIK